MGRFLGWTLGFGFALAISAAPASAQTHVSVGVFGGNFGAHVDVGRPVYYPPAYHVPVYREPVYYPVYAPAYRPVYRPVYRSYRPVYRDRVIVVHDRHDNGKHKGWYKNGKNGKHGRGPAWRDDRYRDGRRW